MTVSLKHTFTSAKTDSSDITIVQPSNWNAEHQLTLATNRLLGRTTAGTGAAEEISVSAPLSLSGGALAVSTIPVANGGTGAVTLTGYVKGNGTSAMTASASVPVGDLSGTLPVASGGTGATTLTANNVVLGNGTSAVQFVAPSTSGNVLTSNGTTWTSTAATPALQGVMTVLTSGTSYTIPAGVTKIKATVVGGGGGSSSTSANGTGGGGGGTAVKYFTVTPGASITYAVGAAGTAGSNGGASTVTVGATTITGNGGTAGSTTANSYSSGGSATNGDLNVSGSAGGGAISISIGGKSLFGAGGMANSSGYTTNSVGYGSGAATITAAGSTNVTDGVVIIEY
jgi:hypothetical protein